MNEDIQLNDLKKDYITDLINCHNCIQYNKLDSKCMLKNKEIKEDSNCENFEENIGTEQKTTQQIRDDIYKNWSENLEQTTNQKKQLASLKEEIYQALIIYKDQNKASEIIVQAILKENYIHTTRDDEKSEMWIYQDGIYTPNAKTYIMEYCRLLLGKTHTTTLTNKVIFKIESDTFINQEELFKEGNINYVPIQNGLLNLKTQKVENFTPKKRFFSKLPITYKKGVDCQNIKKHLETVLKNPKEDMKIFQQLIGFMLLRDYKFEKSFILSGNGRNGKSKTLEIIKKFLGMENTINVSLQRLETDPFVISEFHKKLANLADDIGKKQLYATETFKNLTGRGMITGNRKFKTTVNFQNYAKFVFCANEIPTTCDNTDAFFDRWIGLEFPYRFMPLNEYNQLKTITNEKIQDPEIIDKISTDEELTGLLNWGLEGLKILNKQKGFTINQTSKDIKNFWIRKSDSFAAFCIDNITEDYDSHITKEELRKVYSIYCREHKLTPKSDKHIKKYLLEELGAWEDRINDLTRTNIWKNITLKDKEFGQDGQDGQGFHTYTKKINSSLGLNTLSTLSTLSIENNVLDDKPKPCENLIKLIKSNDRSFGVSEDTLKRHWNKEEDLFKCLDKLRTEGLIFESKPGIWRLL